MKFKLVIFLLLILSASLSVRAQKKDDTWRIKEAGTTTPSFENISYYKKQILPFKEIIVIDKRFDSSKTGYANVMAGRNKYSRIILKNDWNSVINNYFRNNLDSSSDQSLVIVIKSFWLQRGAIDELTSKKVVQKPIYGATDFGGHCKSALDVYVQSGSQIKALFQVDTSFISLISNFNKRKIEDFFFLPFDSVARKIATVNVSEILARKRNLSWMEVNNFYDDRFSLPVLKDAVIKKGVFMTFNDFKNNTPVATEFIFHSGRLTDELYLGGKGNEQIITEYWGFCDGKDLYIRSGFNAFKAIRQQNSFELFGSKHISNYHNYAQQGDISIVSYGLDEMILQVNMDNGKIF